MTFDISTFRGNLIGRDSRDVARQSKYELIISLPSKIKVNNTTSGAAVNGLRFRLDGAELPGRSIQTTNYKPHGYGLTSKIGYDVIYPDLNVSMICGKDLGEKALFQAWQSIIVGNHTRNEGLLNQMSVGYYSDYTSTIGILQYDESGEIAYRMSLLEAYPVILNSMPLSWASDDLHRLNVQFAYKYFKEDDEPPVGGGATGGGRGSLKIDFGFSINDVADSVLTGFGLPKLTDVINIPEFNNSTISIG